MGISATFFDRDAVAVGKFAPWPVPLLSEWPVIGPLLFNKPPITLCGVADGYGGGICIGAHAVGLRTRAVVNIPVQRTPREWAWRACST